MIHTTLAQQKGSERGHQGPKFKTNGLGNVRPLPTHRLCTHLARLVRHVLHVLAHHLSPPRFLRSRRAPPASGRWKIPRGAKGRETAGGGRPGDKQMLPMGRPRTGTSNRWSYPMSVKLHTARHRRTADKYTQPQTFGWCYKKLTSC